MWARASLVSSTAAAPRARAPQQAPLRRMSMFLWRHTSFYRNEHGEVKLAKKQHKPIKPVRIDKVLGVGKLGTVRGVITSDGCLKPFYGKYGMPFDDFWRDWMERARMTLEYRKLRGFPGEFFCARCDGRLIFLRRVEARYELVEVVAKRQVYHKVDLGNIVLEISPSTNFPPRRKPDPDNIKSFPKEDRFFCGKLACRIDECRIKLTHNVAKVEILAGCISDKRFKKLKREDRERAERAEILAAEEELRKKRRERERERAELLGLPLPHFDDEASPDQAEGDGDGDPTDGDAATEADRDASSSSDDDAGETDQASKLEAHVTAADDVTVDDDDEEDDIDDGRGSGGGGGDDDDDDDHDDDRDDDDDEDDDEDEDVDEDEDEDDDEDEDEDIDDIDEEFEKRKEEAAMERKGGRTGSLGSRKDADEKHSAARERFAVVSKLSSRLPPTGFGWKRTELELRAAGIEPLMEHKPAMAIAKANYDQRKVEKERDIEERRARQRMHTPRPSAQERNRVSKDDRKRARKENEHRAKQKQAWRSPAQVPYVSTFRRGGPRESSTSS